MKVDLFNIVNFKADGGAMFGVVPKVLWSRVYKSDENNLVTLSLRSLIVSAGDRVILVDTGWGDKQDDKFFRHLYLHDGEGLTDGLLNRGFTPGDVTDVFLTHLHADHCGGCVRKNDKGTGYELVFPNAIHHVSRTQWEWALKNNPREEDAFLEENYIPVHDSGRLGLVDEEGELFENFSVRICNGHTPGMMIPLVKYRGRTLVFAGDLIPTAAHLPLVWNMSYDIESLKTIDEKKKILGEALENDYILVFQHDLHVECCDLKVTPKGIGAKNIFKLSEI